MRLSKVNNLPKLLIKHSDAAIYSYYTNAAKNLRQLSVEYHNNPVKLNALIVDLTQRSINFRDALSDLTDPKNKVVVEDHYKYFWDSCVRENSQIRGPQIHLASQMFRESSSYNNVHSSGITGFSLGNILPISKPHKVVCATNVINSINVLSGYSDAFQQGLEYQGARMYSSASTNTIHLTNDDPNYISNTFGNKPIVSNIPGSNKVGDFVREYKPNINKTILIEEDAKIRSQGQIFSLQMMNQPSVTFVGSLTESEQGQLTVAIAKNALQGGSNVYHLDPKRNNSKDIILELNHAIATRKHEDLMQFGGIHIPIPNKD